jgi:hypothetical protein
MDAPESGPPISGPPNADPPPLRRSEALDAELGALDAMLPKGTVANEPGARGAEEGDAEEVGDSE